MIAGAFFFSEHGNLSAGDEILRQIFLLFGGMIWVLQG